MRISRLNEIVAYRLAQEVFIGGLAKAKSSMYLVSGRRGPTFGIDLTTF
jgi:hypothetical protein